MDFLAAAFLYVHGHAHSPGEVRDRLKAVRDLHVREELLLVSALHAPGRRLEVGLSVRIAVLQLRQGGDLRDRPVVVARHAERPLEPQLRRHDVCYVNAIRPVLGLQDDVVVLARVAQRAHVSSALLRIKLVARLHLAPRRHVARVDVRAVGHLYRYRSDLRSLHRAGQRQKRRQKRSFHVAAFVFEVQSQSFR